jgi:hypothetical protein
MIPTLSQVRSYNVDHLHDHAAYWTDLANKHSDTFSTVKSDADGSGWTGAGGTAMKASVATLHSAVGSETALLNAAAQSARGDASILDGQQRAIMNTVNSAEQQGFSISDEWVITDTQFSPGSPGWIARQPAANAIAAQLVQQVGAFTLQEYQTGSTLAQHSIQLVDNTSVINMHVGEKSEDNGKHHCDPLEIGENTSKGLAGAAGIGGGLAGEIPSVGGSTVAVLAGIGALLDSVRNLSQCK